jgi:high-affinity iron transporter
VLAALLISFREGLESFLIVGVIVAYLRKTGRGGMLRGVQVGLGISAVTCTLGAYLWYRWLQSETGGPNQSLYEGIAALAAAVLVGALLWQTIRVGRRLKGDIEARVERMAGGDEVTSLRAVAGVALVTTLLVTREGLEAVLFLGVQAFAAKALSMTVGAGIGILGAGLVAWVWSRYSNRLQIGVVLKVTSIFLGLFLLQLLLYGLHELSESGWIQGTQGFHDATERFGPDGDIGQWIAFSMTGAPFLYVLFARRKPKPPASGATGPGPIESKRAAAQN